MAQVIPPNYPQSFGEGALKGISQTLPDALNAYLERQRKQEELKQEDVALKSLGYDVGGVRNPRLRELLLEGKQKEKKELADFSADSKNYSTINDAFGEKFANVWKASDRGARTELVKSALDATLRGLDINELFSSSELTDLPEKDQISEAKTIEKPIETFEDPFKNLTPKEKVTKRKELRSENLPVYKESQGKVRSLQKEVDSLDTLNKLNESKKLPEGLGRIIINPMTGEPYGLAQLFGKVNPETQRWVKTINDFTTKAKDSFGSRVTNFDLQQFLRRLPGLLNTYDGRKQIIEQMKTINQLDSLYENAIKNVYKTKGLENISYEEAVDIAERNIEDPERELRDKFDRISDTLDSLEFSEGNTTTFDQLPSPKQYIGKRIQDEESGEIFESDGKSWKKVK